MQEQKMTSKIDLSGINALLVGTPDPLTNGVAQTLEMAGATIQWLRWSNASARGLPHVDTTYDKGIEILSFEAESPDSLANQFNNLAAFHVAIVCPDWLHVGSFLETSPRDWELAINHNIERVIWAAQAAAKAMIARHEPGKLIFLSSFASLMPFVESSIMGTTLAALAGMARMAAVTLGPKQITVNTVACGWVGAGWQQPYLESARAHIEAGIPLGYIGLPSDVGNVCCFLASDLSRYMTGTVVSVDGGYTLTRGEGHSPYGS
jgi:NAD(P)-dependent dehydrogenase (short-subunit alcohol dehydrogenase family)